MTPRYPWRLILAVMLLATGSCDLPVRVGVEHLRTATGGGGEALAAAPPSPGSYSSRPTEPSIPIQAQAPAVPHSPYVSRPRDPTGPVQTQAPPPTPAPVQAVKPPTPLHAQAARAPGQPAPNAIVVLLPALPPPSGPDDLRAIRLEGGGASRRPFVTFGQVFAPGAVPSGSSIIAQGRSGPLPTQADIKTTHPDGSARMTVVTVRADREPELMLRRTRTRASETPVALGNPAHRYDLRVSLKVLEPGPPSDHEFDFGALLSRAVADGRVSRWLSGPLVSEGRVEVPVTGSMRLVADIRAYADGTVLTDLQFNNDIAMSNSGGALTYDVTVTSNGRTVFRQDALQHFQYQTWHQEIWSDGREEPHVVHDVPRLSRAGAVPPYDTATGVDGALIARLTATMSKDEFRILGSAGLAKYMGMAGGRGEIGITTQANAIWLLTQHPDAKRFAIAQADAAGSIPWHYHDRAAGTAISPHRHPKLWVDGRAGQTGTIPLTQPVGSAAGWAMDNAHQPNLSYVPYVLSGSRYRYDQLESQALYAILSLNPGYRDDAKGVVVKSAWQVRGRAWAFRAIEEAAFAAPDDAPLRPYFSATLRNCIEHLESEMRWRTMGETYGAFADGTPGKMEKGMTGPWQQDFFASVLGMAALRGVPGALELVEWMANFIAGRYTSAEKGFRPNNGTAFYLAVAPENGREPYLTWRELEAANIERKIAKDSSELAGNLNQTFRISRGTLGIMASVTNKPQVWQALDWVNGNLPGVSAPEQQRDPTWSIIPLRARGG